MIDLPTDGPKEVLRLNALMHRDVAQSEKILCLIEVLLSVVIAFE